MKAPQCEHAFCSSCINEWLSRQQTCPVDRSQILPGQMKPAPRILRNLLARLTITCDNAHCGCMALIRLENLAAHVQVIALLLKVVAQRNNCNHSELCSSVIDINFGMLQECEYNPKKLIRCDKGCEQLVAKDELPVGLPNIASWRLLKTFLCGIIPVR